MSSSSPIASRPFRSLLRRPGVSRSSWGFLALAISGLAALNRRAGHAAQLTAVGLLAAIVASEALVKATSLPGVVHVGLALTIGVGIACAYAMRARWAGTFVSMLSVGVVAFPVLFLIDPPMRPFLQTARPHRARRCRPR